MVDAIYNITPEQFQKQGIHAVFTDLDNTLLAWNNPDGTQQLKDWIAAMQAAGIPIVVVSNNNHRRVGQVVENLDLPYVARAMKPLSLGIEHAKEKMNLSRHEIVMVGDQLITDVHAGNLAGLRTILVRPLIDTDAWNTKLNRFLEKFLFFGLRKKYPALHWQEDLND
ncbi:hypothetical protein IV38_GL000623 [Lactobacillus selangorensis]|uniref:HAD superfamily hydrolase n=2 Tax=Lactobacillus selangorensis TaxID=81857 RepID=A0A0R2FZU7_9LACO|nr:hypothetical protein IV38_GL000623 [Lactobacillus selangorensis]KRN33736.1 hypothetical protein IV40_GL000044 [Lactobacillus selangorensis]